MNNMINWENKTAIITGAAGGIGSAICQKVAGMKLSLLLVGRREEALLALADELMEQEGIKVLTCAGDLTDTAFVRSLPGRAKETFGGLDVLINCAGMAQHDSFEEVSEDTFDQIMALNVKAPYFLCQASLPFLRQSSCGTIINIASVVAHKGYPMQSVYAASKHALLGLSKSLANEVYAENIRVHVVSPGAVYTPMIALARPDLKPDTMILPEDVADIVAFYLEHRGAHSVIDEIQVHRADKEPFA